MEIAHRHEPSRPVTRSYLWLVTNKFGAYAVVCLQSEMGMRYDAPADKHSFLREVELWREHTRSTPCLSSLALCGPSPSRKSLRRKP